MDALRLVLASASPRRAELLHAAGFTFDVIPADVDERMLPDESPAQYVRRLAEAKANAIRPLAAGRTVLGADTIVVVGGRVFGKPDDAEDARRMLRELSGRTHAVLTGVAIIGQTRCIDVAETSVEFSELTPEEIDWYIATGEPMDKAGAYAIQGRAARFVTRIDGSYSNVVGLPISLVYALLQPGD